MTESPSAAWPVVGHAWAVDHLDRAIRHGRLRHAYLFTGPDQIGKTTLALAFAAAVNCPADRPPCGRCRHCTLIAKSSHADVSIIAATETGGTLKIDQVRDLQQALALRPYEARYRVVILRRFHDARPTAQDALLKTLEEPSPNTVLILTTSAVDQLLPTIVSRCQTLHLRPLPLELVRETLEWNFGAPQDVARTLARLSAGRLGWAVQSLQDVTALDLRNDALDALAAALAGNRRDRFALGETLAKDKARLLETLDLWLGYWRDALLLASGSRAPITNIDRDAEIRALAKRIGREAAQDALIATRRTLDHLGKNVNTRLALEVLMLDYPAPGFQVGVATFA